MIFRLSTPGYRNGGFFDFAAISRGEAEIKARKLVQERFPQLTQILLQEAPDIRTEEKLLPIVWK